MFGIEFIGALKRFPGVPSIKSSGDAAAPAGISISSSTGTGSRKVGQQPIEGLNI